MFKGCFNEVSNMFERSFSEESSKVVQVRLKSISSSFKGVSGKFPWCFKEVSKRFQGSYKSISRMFQWYLEKVSKVFQG